MAGNYIFIYSDEDVEASPPAPLLRERERIRKLFPTPPVYDGWEFGIDPFLPT